MKCQKSAKKGVGSGPIPKGTFLASVGGLSVTGPFASSLPPKPLRSLPFELQKGTASDGSGPSAVRKSPFYLLRVVFRAVTWSAVRPTVSVR